MQSSWQLQHSDHNRDPMSSNPVKKGKITYLLCGGVHIYPGPRFSNHLMHEHGVVFNLDYIIQASQYKDIHSSLPPVTQNTPRPSYNQCSQTDEFAFRTKCSRCLQSASEILTSTPVRKNVFDTSQSSSRSINVESLSCISQAKKFCFNKKDEKDQKLPLQLVSSRSNQDQVVDVSAVTTADLPVRSGFRCECALCNFVTNDDTSLWGHITKKHRLNYKEYKKEHGLGQVPIGSGKFQCLLCPSKMKHMPGSVDKHLKARHRLNWSQYLDWFRKERMGSEQHQDLQVKSGSVDGSVDKTLEESQPLTPSELTIKNTRPLNIRDKTNKYCSFCEITFPSRLMFLNHCQQVHKLRFKNKTGGPVTFKQSHTSSEEAQLHTPPQSSNKLSTNIAHQVHVLPLLSSKHQKQSTSSCPDMRVSSTKKKKGEGTVPCKFCLKKFSSVSNLERHVRLACQGAPSEGHEVNENLYDTPMLVVDKVKGFKCNRCGRLFSKLGNLNRHHLYKCNNSTSQ